MTSLLNLDWNWSIFRFKFKILQISILVSFKTPDATNRWYSFQQEFIKVHTLSFRFDDSQWFCIILLLLIYPLICSKTSNLLNCNNFLLLNWIQPIEPDFLVYISASSFSLCTAIERIDQGGIKAINMVMLLSLPSSFFARSELRAVEEKKRTTGNNRHSILVHVPEKKLVVSDKLSW